VPDFAPRRMTLDAELNLVYLAQNADTDPARRGTAATESADIGVLYPDIAEPYRSVFTKIVAGIEESARSRVHTFAVGATVDAADLNRQMRRNHVKVVIALGRQGL